MQPLLAERLTYTCVLGKTNPLRCLLATRRGQAGVRRQIVTERPKSRRDVQEVREISGLNHNKVASAEAPAHVLGHTQEHERRQD